MQAQIEQIIRQHPNLPIKEAMAIYHEQCKQTLESLSHQNIVKIEEYFRKLCQKKYGEDTHLTLNDFANRAKHHPDAE